MNKTLLIASVMLAYVYCLNFKLQNGEEFCMRFQGGKSYTLEYVVSGNEDQNVKCTIKQDEKVIIQKEGVSEFEYSDEYKSQSVVWTCFQSTDGLEKQISFDFYEFNDPIRKMIDKKDVNLVESVLVDAYKQMQSISRNQQYQIERDETHKQNLQDSQSKIKWAGIIKIVFLLGSALIQLWIMKGFFTNNNPYQPVETA